MTNYAYRFFIFVTIDKIVPGNNMAAAWDPDSGGSNTFGNVALSTNGLEPPTHTACNTAATESMKNGIEQAFSVVPWAGLYKQSDGWTWQSSLDDMGLKIIEITV